MQGDERVIEFLNEQLTAELTAINQYFLHYKMQENWGYAKLAKYTRSESLDEMRHAEVLTDRILFLDGLPNYQRLFPLRIGQSVPEIFRCDREIEVEAIDRLKRGIEHMESVKDYVSRDLFESILKDEEHHIDYLDTQLDLIEKLGRASTSRRSSSSPRATSHDAREGRLSPAPLLLRQSPHISTTVVCRRWC
ncbi:bacterioferritin [Glycomyces albus]